MWRFMVVARVRKAGSVKLAEWRMRRAVRRLRRAAAASGQPLDDFSDERLMSALSRPVDER